MIRRRRAPVRRTVSTVEDHPNLSGGLAVAIAVTTLLEVLRRAIGNRSDREITGIWVAGRQLSQQIVGTHLLKDLVTETRFLIDELEQHVDAREETTR